MKKALTTLFTIAGINTLTMANLPFVVNKLTELFREMMKGIKAEMETDKTHETTNA